MTSLSDSQNLDLHADDDLAAIALPASSPIQACGVCEALIDITEREPLEHIGCPHCGAELIVHGQIDHFELVEVAGRGGMGVVYKAYDPGLDRHVALKLLRKDHSGQAELIAQLENEAAITASVTDPNIVRVYATGTDRNRFYIAMELVDKGSLDDLIRLQGRIAEVQALEVGIQIARGLRAAQQHGLIHRDVKPGNILFADAHTAKIVDFGLAIFMEQEESVRGEIWGTPYYVAPEKLDSLPEDFRSDIYSLGASLFHALAGRPPFEAETATLVALKHLKSQPVSISAFAPWVSGATAFVINRTLHKNPDERYQSYDELIGHLEYALNEVQQAATQQQPRARVVLETEEDEKRTGWVVLSMLAVVVLLLGGLFLFRKQIFHHDQPGAVAKTPSGANSPAPSASALATYRFAFPNELDLLAAGNADAGNAFRQAGAREKLSATDHAWAALLEGTAELRAGHGPAARTAFQQLQTLAIKTGNEKLTTFFIGTAARMLTEGAVAPGDAKDLDRGNHEAIALLLYGLKNWQLGKTEDGTALLRQFRSANPAGNAAWVGQLKPLATNLIEDATALQMQADALKAAATTPQRAAVAAQLRRLSGPLTARVQELLAPFAQELDQYQTKLNAIPVDGLYKIINRKSGKCVDVVGGPAGGLAEDANVNQYHDTGGANQQWQLSRRADGTCQFLARHSKRALDVDNARPDDGTNVRQHTINDSPAEQWQIEPAGDGFFKLRAVCSGKVLNVSGGSTDDSANIDQWTDNGSPEQQWRFIPIATLPKGWSDIPLGTSDVAAEVALSNDTYTITAAGSDIWTENDNGHFVSCKLSGDFEIIAHVASVEATDEWAKAGVMIRETTDANSRNTFTLVSARHGTARQCRPANGVASVSEIHDELPGPRWLKLVRTGDTIASFHSENGQQWTAFGTETIAGLPSELLAGLAVSSHDHNRATTAVFDHVSARPTN